MSVTLAPRRWTSRAAAAAVAALALSTLALQGPAEAFKPDGSRAEVMLETGDVTADPANAITSGWWGHEGSSGPSGTGSTYLSLNGANGAGVVDDASIAALLSAMGTTDLSNIFYAVVPTSADGSNEAPSVAVGENAAEAFDWVTTSNFGTAWSGSSAANDSVVTVSTLSQVTAWVAAGRPVQGYDSSLVLHDVTAPGNPVSTAPQGTSILNTWPAGTDLSLVAYVANGMDPDLDNQVPIVARDGSGKAKTAWIPFTTVASPTSALRTSAGYQLSGPYAPTLSLADTFVGADGTLTATVKTNAGVAATDATGTVEFAQVVGGVAGTPTSVPVEADGTASLPITGLAAGGLRTYDVRYVPDSGAAALYLTTAWKRYSVINELPTTTKLVIKGGTTDTFTATVAPAATAGTVTFKDGSKSLGSASVSGGKATLKKLLTAGKHTVTATFAPSDTSFGVSSATKDVWAPKVVGSVSPKKVKVGSKPKLAITVTSPGTSPAGTAKVTVAAGGKPTTLTVKISATGKATVTLPKAKRGTTKVTISYQGNAKVLASVKSLSFKVT